MGGAGGPHRDHSPRRRARVGRLVGGTRDRPAAARQRRPHRGATNGFGGGHLRHWIVEAAARGACRDERSSCAPVRVAPGSGRHSRASRGGIGSASTTVAGSSASSSRSRASLVIPGLDRGRLRARARRRGGSARSGIVRTWSHLPARERAAHDARCAGARSRIGRGTHAPGAFRSRRAHRHDRAPQLAGASGVPRRAVRSAGRR